MKVMILDQKSFIAIFVSAVLIKQANEQNLNWEDAFEFGVESSKDG